MHSLHKNYDDNDDNNNKYYKVIATKKLTGIYRHCSANNSLLHAFCLSTTSTTEL